MGGFNLSSGKIHLISQRFWVNPDFLLVGTGPIFSIQKKLILMKLLPSRFSDIGEYQETMNELISAGAISEISCYSSGEGGPDIYLFYSSKYSQYLVMLEELHYLKLYSKKERVATSGGMVSKNNFTAFQNIFKLLLWQFDNEKLNSFKKLCGGFVADLKTEFKRLAVARTSGLNLLLLLSMIPETAEVKRSAPAVYFDRTVEFFKKFNNDLRTYTEKEVLPPPAIGNRIFEVIQFAHKIDLSPEEFKAASENLFAK